MRRARPGPRRGGGAPAGAAARPRFYGRRRGHRLRPGRRRLLDELLPRIRVPDPGEAGAVEPLALFAGAVGEVWLEIGFGSGEHLAAQAAAHPAVGLIGCEPFVNGLSALLAEVERLGLANVRVFPDDARLLIPALPEASLARAFILFPDPWPKARHAKRRLIDDQALAALARVLADGAEVRIATDDAGYLRWILACLARAPAFAWLARRPADWRHRPAGWPPTRYEAKALAEGRTATYLRLCRLPRGPGQGRERA
ncbi:MAG: tRNA (guanosine(46)-N7)-methyltransferase TrmB [Proteobacteria bacterium]|nr:tRNA (guanosine(46)-N7)-methyltransferase TrmB [Pseudomonadota bacterium]